MRFFLTVLLFLVLCGVTSGDPPPAWPPPSYVIERQWQNIMDYGAKGDGTTDDRAAIQAALDAVGDSGGCVFVPHSDSGFRIDSTLFIGPYTTLLGFGRGSKLFIDPAHIPFTMLMNLHGDGSTPHDTGIVIDGIYWDQGRDYIRYDSTDSASIVELRHARKCVVRNCFFTRSDKDGVALRYSQDCKIINNVFWEMGEEGVVVAKVNGRYNIVSGNHFIMRDSDYVGLSGPYADQMASAILVSGANTIISNNVFRYGGGGIDMDQIVAPTVPSDSSDTTFNVIITNNQFVEIHVNNCITPKRSYNVIISDNTFFDCNARGIYSWGPGDWTYGQGIADTTVHDFIVTGNQFLNQKDICILAQSGHGYVITNNIFSNVDTTAIKCAGSRSVITGNKITGVAAGYGIHITAQENSIISDNQVSYVDKSGIYCEAFAAAHEYLSITGNSVRDCGDYGISLTNVGFSTINDNVCVGNNLGGIYLSGSKLNTVNGNICTSSADSTQEYGIVITGSIGNYISNNQLGGNASDTGILNPENNHVYANKEDTVSSTFIDFLGRINLTNIDNTARITVTGLSADLRLNATDGSPFIDFLLDTAQIWRIQADSTSHSFTFNDGGANRLAIATTGAVTLNEAITLPTTDSIAGYVWATNGSGQMVWVPNDTGAGAGGEANTLVDTGTFDETSGFGLAQTKAGTELRIRGLIEGSNITISASGDTGWTIAGPAGAGTIDSFYVFFTDSASAANGNQHVNGYLHPNDTLYVDTTGGAVVLEDVFNFMHPDIFDTTGFNDSIGIKVDAITSIHLDDAANTPEDLDIVVMNVSGPNVNFEYNTPNELGLMVDEDINTFSELQSWVADKTLVNEEDVATIDANWVNTANPWADNEIATSGDWNRAVDSVDLLDDLTAAYFWLGNVSHKRTAVTMSADATMDNAGAVTVVDDLHDHVYSNIDQTTSTNWRGRVSDPTGTGAWVFGTNPTLTTGVKINLAADSNVTIDARTNTRTVTVGALRLNLTPQVSTPNTRAIYVDVDANSVPGTQGLHIHYEATALAAGETGIGIDVEGLTSTSTGGDIQALKVSKSGTGSAEVHAIHVSAGVHVIDQLSGSFVSPTQAWGRDTSLTAWANLTSPDAVGSSTIDSTLFEEVDDYLYVGNTVAFNEIDFVFNTFAGGPGISPTFEFSIAGPNWTTFTPIDNTDGCRQNGGIEWAVADLTSWASVTVNGIASYYVRILRNQAGAATAPIEDRIRISVTTEYQWNSDGDLNINSLDVDGNVTLSGTVDTVDVGALAAKVHKEDLKYFMFNLADPDALYATDAEWSIDPRTAQAITIDSFTVSLNADPTTELTFSLKYADAFIGFANAVVIDDTATVAGVTTVTGGFGDATVPAGKCIYWLFDADPDDAITQVSVKIHYSID